MPRPSGTWTMPSRAILNAGIALMSWLLKVIWPELAVTSPLTTLATVDLPAPFEPSRATIAPGFTSNEMPNRARYEP